MCFEDNGLKRCVFLLILILFIFNVQSYSQTITAGEPFFEERVRRNQLLDSQTTESSFLMRPIFLKSERKNEFFVSPVRWSVEYNTKRPYGWGNYLLKPNVGVQTLLTFGFEKSLGPLYVRMRPEFTYAQNKAYTGYSGKFPNGVNASKFHYWNNSDSPERFGVEPYGQMWWGQSLVSLRAGPMEVGISTENIWWGPGQFHDLTFSSNSKGFPHLTLNSYRPIKTFAGDFETQLILGKLADSGYQPSQITDLNDKYFQDTVRDDRFLSALLVTYRPKWVPNLYLGLARTFQRYYFYQGDSFSDYFPVFQAFQKEKFFEDGMSIDYDADGFDQQLTLSFRYVVPSAHFEIYGEYGRRDHAYDYRDFILSPDHARAFLFGFQKLIPIKVNHLVQIRAEYLNQQSSVNRYIRYPGLLGGFAWGTHYQARGFTQEGESLGSGAGTGSNVQSIEISLINDIQKRGILIERLTNQQDFYYAAFGRVKDARPWIDYSLGLLWDQQWDRLILSGKAQFILAQNYQWQANINNNPDFFENSSIGSFFGQVNLIYRLGEWSTGN
jgi:hypothetical protein